MKYEVVRRMDWQDYMLAVFVSCMCVLFMSFYSKIPQPFDLYLAMPIAKEAAFPGLYSHNDLIIQSGLRIPFYFYQIIAGGLYKFTANPEVIWHFLYLISLLIYFTGIWILGFEISQNAAAPSLLAFFLAAAPVYRGSLHDTCVPLHMLVSAQAAVPIGIFSLIMLFRGESLKGLALAAAAFNFHPYVGLILIAFAAAAFLIRSKKTRLISSRKDLFLILLSAALILPSALNIFSTLSNNFSIDPATSEKFFDQFRIYSHHVFVEDYWNKEYAWFFLSLIVLRLLMPFTSDKKQIMNALLYMAFFLMGIYLVNLYVLKKKFLLIMFLFRATYFLKPLIFLFVINGMQKWLNALPVSEKKIGYIVAAASFISVLVYDVYYANFFGFIACGVLMLRMTLFQKLAKSFIFLGMAECLFALLCSLTALDLADKYKAVAAAINVAVAGLGVLITWNFGENEFRGPINLKPHPGFMKRLKLAFFCGVFIFGSAQMIHAACFKTIKPLKPESLASISQRVRFSHPAPEMRGLISWIKQNTPMKSLFVVPPLDDRFENFRLAAERGVFARLADVNQVLFDTQVYSEAQDRLYEIGFRIKKRRVFDDTLYEKLTVAELLNLTENRAADYAVFTAAQKNRFAGGCIVYQDENFLLIDLKKLEALGKLQ